MTAVILGCGFTGSRVAQNLSVRGVAVKTTSRRTLDVSRPFTLDFIPSGAVVLHSIPALPEGDVTPQIVEALGNRPSRVVYLSTTGVYGEQTDVDQTTPVAPQNPRAWERVRAENAILAGPWSALVLRSAAIYGPGRGVHASLAAGKWKVAGDGSNYISRIHVDDLAAITAEALLRPEITGAYPVADDEPSTVNQITKFCAELLHVPRPEAVPLDAVHHTRQGNRRVNGRAIREALNVELRYPSYRTGIPASLAVLG